MFSIANWLQVIIKVLMNPSRAVDQARFYLFCFRTNALLTMVILAHVIAVLQWVSSWLQVGSASLSLSVLLTAIFVGEGKTVPPSTSTTHIRDNSVMSNNINNLPRVNHLGNVSILTSPRLLSLPSQATGYDGTGMQILRWMNAEHRVQLWYPDLTDN